MPVYRRGGATSAQVYAHLPWSPGAQGTHGCQIRLPLASLPGGHFPAHLTPPAHEHYFLWVGSRADNWRTFSPVFPCFVKVLTLMGARVPPSLLAASLIPGAGDPQGTLAGCLCSQLQSEGKAARCFLCLVGHLFLPRFQCHVFM